MRVNSKRHGLSVVSTVTNKEQTRWKAFDGALNSDILIDFLRRLIKDAGRKVYLILDNLRVHHSKPVKAWLAEHQHEIEVFYLPSYSPELNPNETPTLSRPSPSWPRRAPSCNWSRPRQGTCAAFSEGPSGSEATSPM